MEAMTNRLVLVLSRWRTLLGQGLHTITHSATKTSIAIRHVDGGSSNIFELELEALTNPIYDIAQYGIDFVSSPHHADILLLTTPLSWNMVAPAHAAFEAMSPPKWIVTIGDFAQPTNSPTDLSHIFELSYATATLPAEMAAHVIAHIPGDPPSPLEIIETLVGLDIWESR